MELFLMRVSGMRITGSFKRFGALEISSIGTEVDLVVMLGPNGSGKSSVFDAFLHWARKQGRKQWRQIPDVYFDSAGSHGQPEVMLHGASASGPRSGLGPLVHVRTAHRNTPDVLANTVQKQEEFRNRNTCERMIDTDAALGEHYQRLVARFLPIVSNLESPDAGRDLEILRAELTPVQDALSRVLPHMRFTGLGDPTSEGSFYFIRDGVRNFRYENLSGGEKAIFDLLLDVHVAATELSSPLICLDEPELHLNPAVQAAVLTELLGLLPRESQMWIATHSVGMIREAFDISAKEPGRVAFLDFGRVEGPAPSVRLEPEDPSRLLLADAMAVALDDLAGLLAPEVLIVCEGSQHSDRVRAFDEHIYRRIFSDLHQRVEFISSGGKRELEQAAAIAAVIAPGTRLLKLRDRDDLTDDARRRLLEADPALRVLERRSLESYLLTDDVLEALVDARGSRVEDAFRELKAARDKAIHPNGSAKGALGTVFETAKRVLEDIEQLGENASQFSADVLAALIVPGTNTRTELEAILDLERC